MYATAVLAVVHIEICDSRVAYRPGVCGAAPRRFVRGVRAAAIIGVALQAIVVRTVAIIAVVVRSVIVGLVSEVQRWHGGAARAEVSHVYFRTGVYRAT